MRGPRQLWKDARGATAIEYGLICALVFLAMVGGISQYGVALSGLLYNVATKAGNRM